MYLYSGEDPGRRRIIDYLLYLPRVLFILESAYPTACLFLTAAACGLHGRAALPRTVTTRPDAIGELDDESGKSFVIRIKDIMQEGVKKRRAKISFCLVHPRHLSVVH